MPGPEHVSGCSGRISPPCGRSMDMQVHLHIRHSLAEKTGVSARFSPPHCRYARHWHSGKNLLWNLEGFSLLPPPCRASDSQQRSGRFSVLHPPRMGGVSTPGRARRRQTAYLRRAKKKTCGPVLCPRKGRPFRTAWGRCGHLPYGLFLRGLFMEKNYEGSHRVWFYHR